MSFHEVQFSTRISYGSKGGPGFNTNIITTDSGQEQRVARWSQSRRTYDVSYGIKSTDDLYAVQSFFIARLGPAYGFRYKDWVDFTTAANGRDDPSPSDEALVDNGDGTYQLVKRYTSGPVTRVRKIKKPVSGTVRVAVNGTEWTSGWTVDLTTGIVTLSSGGAPVTGGCAFDVPVRFGKDVDAGLLLSMDDYDTGSITSIPLEEILDPTTQPDDLPMGGAVELAPSTDFALSPLTAKVWVVAPTTDVNAVLPDFTALATGGPYFYLVVDATAGGSVQLKTSTGAAVGSPVAPGNVVTVILSSDAVGAKVWYVF